MVGEGENTHTSSIYYHGFQFEKLNQDAQRPAQQETPSTFIDGGCPALLGVEYGQQNQMPRNKEMLEDIHRAAVTQSFMGTVRPLAQS